MTEKKATFCIAVYNDTDTLRETIANIYETVDDSEIDIIVVDDAGNIDNRELADFPEVKLLLNKERRGVGYSLHRAVEEAQTEVVFPMGCDIRFTPGWFDRFYEVVKANPHSIICTVTAGLNEERRYIKGNENLYYGSQILFQVTEKNNYKKPMPYREFIEAKWNSGTQVKGEVAEIGCVLGAFYGLSKRWYTRIMGFEGHRLWGGLEPLISLRSYIAGGNCLIDTKTITGHIFKTSSSQKPIVDLIYNKLLIASTLLPGNMEKEVYKWAETTMRGNQAIEETKKDKDKFLYYANMGRNTLTEEELIKRIRNTGILNP